MTQFHAALREAGVAEAELRLWTWHSVRRGAGIDLLQKKSVRPSTGADQMVAEGDWRTRRALLHYVTEEEYERAVVEDTDGEEEMW